MSRLTLRAAGLTAAMTFIGTCLFANPAYAAATTVSLTFLTPSGSAQTGAAVRIYYEPAGKTQYVPKLMASGTTNSSGTFNATLTTSMVPNGDLGYDIGASKTAFNATVIAVGASHNWMTWTSDVFNLGANTVGSYTASIDVASLGTDAPAKSDAALTTLTDVRLTDVGGDPGPDPNESLLAKEAGSPTDPDPKICCWTGQETRRWVAVLNWHVGAGMTSKFTYATGRGTRVAFAYKIGAGSWTASSERIQENTIRAKVTPPVQAGPYHARRYARYRFYKYKELLGMCGCYRISWRADHFTGGLDEVDRNISMPALDYRYAEKLTGTNERSTGNNKIFAGQFGVDFTSLGPGVTLSSKAGYAEITKVSWSAVAGCSQTRWLYGEGEDWTKAPTVFATCAP
jgi:hypothetical protein